jgi:3-hydroxyisobutyrate dehydrogenase-like beta-hydroxyacid dehydrogenase
MLALAECCLDLTSVNLVHSPQVTEVALAVLVQSCRKLKSLQMCSISPDAARRLRNAAAACGQKLEVSLRKSSAFLYMDLFIDIEKQ